MYEKKFAKVTFAESLLWSVYNFPNYLLCNKKYSCRLQLCLTNTEFLPSRITVSLFFGKTFTMPTNGSKERTAVHATPSNHRKQYPVHKQLSWNFLRIRKVINTQFRLWYLSEQLYISQFRSVIVSGPLQPCLFWSRDDNRNNMNLNLSLFQHQKQQLAERTCSCNIVHKESSYLIVQPFTDWWWVIPLKTIW